MNKKNPMYETLLNEYKIIYGKDEKMISYCMNQVSDAVKLSDGSIFYYEKPSIITNFCFGYNTDYSGHESSDAHKRMNNFLKSDKAFNEKNLKDINEDIKNLKNLKGRDVYSASCYLGKCNLISYKIIGEWDFENKPNGYFGHNLKKLNKKDIKLILNLLESEKIKFEKRVDTYFKKYGTSKLNTWTYWKDE